MAENDLRIPVAQAAIQLKLSYNQVRRLIAIGEIEGGYQAGVGYYVSRAALERHLAPVA